MAKFIESRNVFKHHQPISLENMQGLTITGTNGAFREVVRSWKEDPEILTVGVGLEIDPTTGEIVGSRLLMCGNIPEIKISTADIFPEAPIPGKAVFQKTDIGNWTMPRGIMTSHWTRREDNAINWSIKMLTGGRSKTIKFPKHSDYGFGDMAFRINVQPTSVTQAKVSLSAAPVDGAALERMPQWNSRKFPVVAMENFRARIFPQEVEGQHLGLGFQPIFILRGVEHVNIEEVNYPSSMAAKEAAVMLLQASSKPNERINATKWREAVENEEFISEKTTLLWPPPRTEDEGETSDSCASEDTEGELLR